MIPVPAWTMLLPKGPEIRARDGRRWVFDPDRIVAGFAANHGPLVVDYEHAQALKAAKGEVAPAAGWIQQMETRDGAVWGRIEWTAKAEQEIAQRAYLFLSPDMRIEGIQIAALNGAALVNRPALFLAPIIPLSPSASEPRDLASRALAFQQDQAEQGHSISTTDAVHCVLGILEQ